MAEHLREAAHDGEAEAEAGLAGNVVMGALELLEDRVAPVLGNARSGVADLHQNVCSPSPDADQHAAMRRVTEGVGEQVLQDAPQHRRVGAHRAAGGEDFQLQPAFLCEMREFAGERLHDVIQLEGADFRLHDAGVELGEVEQGADQVFERDQAAVHLIDQRAALGAGLHFAQGGQGEPGGVERLKQVVPDRGCEGRLERACGLRLRFRLFDRAHRLLQFLGAAADLMVERDCGLEQGKGVELAVHRAFDPRHQRAVDFLQLENLALEIVAGLAPMHGHDGCSLSSR